MARGKGTSTAVKVLSTRKCDRMLNMKQIKVDGKPVKHLRFDFYFSGRSWYRYNSKSGEFIGPVRSRSGIPRDVEDMSKLWRGFDAAFAAIGAKLESYSEHQPGEQLKYCQSCKKMFEAKRSTARFCKTCREDVYGRRKKEPGYVELNRERAKKGMAQLRTGKFKLQIQRGRRNAATKKKEADARARKEADARTSLQEWASKKL